MKKNIFKGILYTLVGLLLAIAITFLIGRYGWKLCGFHACETAGIEQIQVSENQVQIQGFYPGSFPRGFLGYHAKQVDGILYVGFQFSGLFGIFETGDFDITIPTDGTVSQVIVKSSKNEYAVWPTDESCTLLPKQKHQPDVG